MDHAASHIMNIYRLKAPKLWVSWKPRVLLELDVVQSLLSEMLEEG